ncbi:hypothetical protein F2Q70_00002679 [Brassica cretica]|nr:hypothetical protein F2Q70_00002679 [Brassica cretica]
MQVSIHLAQELRSQPCLAAQYRSMFGLKYRSTSDGRYRLTEEYLRSMMVSECRSMRLVSGSTVVDENQATILLRKNTPVSFPPASGQDPGSRVPDKGSLQVPAKTNPRTNPRDRPPFQEMEDFR